MVAQSESAFGKKLEMAQPRFPCIFRRCEQGNLFSAPYCINENIDIWRQISIIVSHGEESRYIAISIYRPTPNTHTTTQAFIIMIF